MLVVMKFGGSSVADKEKVNHIAETCIQSYRKGNQVVVVLSAMGDTTDELIKKAHSINPNPPRREMDMLLATGEQVSAALMSMAIHSMGVPAVSLNAFQVCMHTNSAYGSAKLKKIDQERISNELELKKIVIITGFQGVNKYDDVTTLGRGGSDTTAVALAAALHADRCEIYTDVEGVYTADPRVVPAARKLLMISYEEMLELSSAGANVLHNRSVELAQKYGVRMVVRSSLTEAEGTVVADSSVVDRSMKEDQSNLTDKGHALKESGEQLNKKGNKMEQMLIRGVAADKNTARISVMGVENEPGTAFRLFHLLAKHHYNVDIILQSVGRESKKDISFTVDRTILSEVVTLLNEHLSYLTGSAIEHESNVAKISIVGAGIISHPGIASKMFEALYNEQINIKMISTSEIRITVLIDEKDADRAMRVVHEAFGLDRE